MFCGTGKSRIITNTIIHGHKDLSVAVFPSLALIHQYSSDYVATMLKPYLTLNVSSEQLQTVVSTTDPATIQAFLRKTGPKLVLVTYQSYDVLLESLNGMKIGLVCYDEAHHVTSIKKQKLVFDTDYFEKEVFFTATPHNENGITMYDREEPEKNMCGELAYDYTYLQGLNDDFLNGFDICLDMYTENTNASIYEGMARAILARGTGRVLTFHSDVNNSESGTSVWNFVNLAEFKVAFSKVLSTEFPKKTALNPKITFKGMDGSTPAFERKRLLQQLDDTANEDIFILSSCETIGEGVDTKRANMCVFADPKTSIVKIIQNIGRVVRKDTETPVSTIFIPCYVNMEHYASANGDPEKQDELIREQMRAANGDYAPILNVLAALKQEDEELYEQCLNYPSKTHKERSLNEQGFTIDEEDEDIVYTEEDVEQMKDDGEPLEIHTNDTIERFNEDNEEEPLTRLYYDSEQETYKPIVKIDEEDDNDRQVIEPPEQKKHISLSIHENSDILMLWSVQGELDFSRKFCSVTIDCSVSLNRVKWLDMLTQTSQFLENGKKRPTAASKNTNERRLGQWLEQQLKRFKNGKMVTEYRPLFQEFCTTYRHYLRNDKEIWVDKLTLVGKFIDDKGRRPTSSPQAERSERKLGYWLVSQLMNFKNGKMLTDYLPLFQVFYTKYRSLLMEFKDVWLEKLTKISKFMDKNKRRPNKEAPKGTEERELGQWLGNQLSLSKNVDLQPAPVSPKLIASVVAATSIPLPRDSQASQTSICAHRKQVLPKKYRSLFQDFLSKYSSLLVEFKDMWIDRLSRTGKFMDDKIRRPNKNASKGSEERELGQWLCNQLQRSKNVELKEYTGKETLPEEYRPLFKDFYKKYLHLLMNDKEVWLDKLKRIRKFMDDKIRKPSSHASKDSEEYELGNWLRAQLDRFKNVDGGGKQTMPVEYRPMFQDLLTTYSHILGTNVSIVSTDQSEVAESPKKITLKPKVISKSGPPPASAEILSTEAQVKPKITIRAKPKPITPTPSVPKTYADLTEEERQKIIERHLKKQAEKKGYRSTNPDDKDTINTVFAQHINVTADGMIIFLDHTEFKTAYALLERGVRPEQMLIPQWQDNYAYMSKHELFGFRVVQGDFNEVLEKYLDSPGSRLKGIYADYCGTLQKDGLPFVELISKYKSKLTPDAIVGVTLTLRNPEGVRFSGQDISMMEKKLTRAFPAHENLFYKAGIIADDDGPYTYGGGAPMATWLISV